MSAARIPPSPRSLPRYRPAGRGPAGRALGVAALLVGLVAAGRAAWLARARRRFAGLRGPRFEKAVGAPAVRLDATAGPAGAATIVEATVLRDDAATEAAPVVDATVVEGERSFAAEHVPDGVTDATVVDDEPGTTS